MSGNEAIQMIKWRDPAGNLYGVEKAVRNGRYVVIRTNPGGNRKAAKQFPAGSLAFVQTGLNTQAEAGGWRAVK